MEAQEDGTGSIVHFGGGSAIVRAPAGKRVRVPWELAMKSRVRWSRISFFFSCLFATSTLFAQPQPDTTTSTYLDFGRFSTIAPADQLDFLDRLKWAGMIFFNAPAARRVVSLYDYSREDISRADCSSDRIQDHRALFVTSLVPTGPVIAALRASVDTDETNDYGELSEVLSALEARSWFEPDDLDLLPRNNSLLASAIPDREFVWHEFSISNSCELQQSISDLDYGALTWHRVDDPKLRTIIQSGFDAAMFQDRIIVDEQLFPESALIRQYYAECMPSNESQRAGVSLCDTVP